jgi:serine/threonine-protein phosphatase 6 regulatory ankyrin repeat subunit B
MVKSLLKTGVLEAGLVTAALLLFGHYQGVLAHPNLTPVQALQQGNHDSLRSALNRGADPNSKDAVGTPLLMHAVLYSDATAVRMLLNNGADPNATNAAGATALIWAAGDPEKAALLIDYGSDVNARSVLGRTPLLVASATDGAGSVVGKLIHKGAETNVHDNLKGNPKLMTGGGSAPAIVEAAKARDGVALRLLLRDPKCDIDATDANGGTALTEAAANGHRDNVRLLLNAGANPNVHLTASGYTALMLAAERNDVEMLGLLLEAGVEVNAADVSGLTALMWAAYSAETGPTTAVEMLLLAGADPAIVNRKGETAIALARWHGQTATVRLLSNLEQTVR